MGDDELFDKRRGQRMLLTKWIKIHNATDDEEEKERAARKLADVLDWATSVGMSPSEIVEDRDLPRRALDLFHAGEGHGSSTSGAEINAAKGYVASAVDTAGVFRVGKGSGSVYAYGYECLPDRLKIGRTEGDVVTRIISQINPSTPDRPKLYLVIGTDHPGPLERALHGALVLRDRRVEGGGAEWFRASVDDIRRIYEALIGAMPAEL